MLARDIAKHIANGGLTTLPVRAARLDATISDGVLVMTPLDGMKKIMDQSGYMRGDIKVIVRHSDPESGDALAKKVSDYLMSTTGVVGDYRIMSMKPLCGEPIMYPINDGGQYEHLNEFDCVCHNIL